jgi:hypothetical protein
MRIKVKRFRVRCLPKTRASQKMRNTTTRIEQRRKKMKTVLFCRMRTILMGMKARTTTAKMNMSKLRTPKRLNMMRSQRMKQIVSHGPNRSLNRPARMNERAVMLLLWMRWM